jgi:hypothetical protein
MHITCYSILRFYLLENIFETITEYLCNPKVQKQCREILSSAIIVCRVTSQPFFPTDVANYGNCAQTAKILDAESCFCVDRLCHLSIAIRGVI